MYSTVQAIKDIAKKNGWTVKEELPNGITFARPGNRDFTVVLSTRGHVKNYHGLDKSIKPGVRPMTGVVFQQLQQEAN